MNSEAGDTKAAVADLTSDPRTVSAGSSLPTKLQRPRQETVRGRKISLAETAISIHVLQGEDLNHGRDIGGMRELNAFL